MLARGGNAADAAVATAIALTVVEPTSNGIGSDAFAVLWDGKAVHGLNASGRSPAGWTADRFAGRETMPVRGWDAVTVPGAVSAWVEVSKRFGKLPFEQLFEPAVGYARDGFAVSPVIGASWARGAEVLSGEPGFAEAFMPGGAAPAVGSVFCLPAMAETLEQIAVTGGAAFYEGSLAEKIVAFSDRCGGVMSRDDLASHRADWVGTVTGRFCGHDIHEIPPNGQGVSALVALGILDTFADLKDLDPDSPEGTHLQVEAMKLAFADLHHHVADRDHMTVATEDLLDKAYLRDRARLVDRSRAGRFEHGTPGPGGTVLLAAADASGMMVSFIQSNYMGFGSGVVVPGTGISLQNRGHGFRAVPGHPNSVGPRKRPFHTIIPAFATRGGEPVMAFGMMGGPMQAQGHVQLALRILAHGQAPQSASDAPRWQVMDDGTLAVEEAMAPTTVAGLRGLGHDVVVHPGNANQAFGGAQVVLRRDGFYEAGSDHRKDGGAAGF
ncbi:MAG: gamma-glutamyltransferase family protein [Fimbriimonadaceae bacterium]|nr:gamma-glutamyltransferase family protein [Fimbriimonadaceae bacterium]